MTDRSWRPTFCNAWRGIGSSSLSGLSGFFGFAQQEKQDKPDKLDKPAWPRHLPDRPFAPTPQNR